MSFWQIVWACLLVLAAAPLSGQPRASRLRVDPVDSRVSARIWGVEQGLPQGSVTELALDGDGYVWGATFGGLFRFDGQIITRYAVADVPMLVTNSVTALLTGPEGLLYVGTPLGTIGRMRGGRLIDTLTSSDRPLLLGVDALAIDGTGTTWLRSGDNVHFYRDGRWSKGPLPHLSYSGLTVDRTGALLYAGPSGLIRATAEGEEILARAQAKAVDEHDFGIHADRYGHVWLGQPDGLYVLINGALQKVPEVQGRVHAIISDGRGMIWVAGDNRLYRFRTGASQAVVSRPELLLRTNSDIFSLLLTPDDVLVGGTLQGLFTMRESVVHVTENPAGERHREVSSMVPAGAGRAWVTGSCTDVYLIDQQGVALDSIARPRNGGCVRSMLLDRRGALWFGNDGVVKRRDAAGQLREWALPRWGNNLSLARPMMLLGDTLMFGLSDGRIAGIAPDDSLRMMAPWDQVSNLAIESMVRDDDGTIWVGQLGRITRWRGRTLEVSAQAEGVPRAVPRALLVEPGRGVWIGTYGSGLWYLAPGERARAVPLVDETISALLGDQRGRLWMPGNRGISVVSRDGLRRWLVDSIDIPDVRLLSDGDGVPEGNAGYPAAAMLAQDVLGFASVAGLVTVHERQIPSATTTSTVRVDEIRTSKGRRLADEGRVRLAPDERIVLLTFSAPTFRFADEVQFRYRLEGRDREWVSAGINRELRLVTEEPGTYTLRLESRVPGGQWQAADPIQFDVQPMLLERQSLRVFLAMAVIGLAVLFYRQRINGLQAVASAREISLHARRDAAEEAARHERELAQVGRLGVAGELTASLSHELGQPLAAIVNNAEVARRMIERGRDGRHVDRRALDDVLRDVVTQGHRASEIVREFRRFLRREKGERETMAVRELMDSAALLLRHEYSAAQVPLEIRIADRTPTITVERVLIQQVIVNLLQNALEAVRRVQGGKVLLRARPVARGIRITVLDNGRGFSRDVRRLAFEPFVTSRATGMGLGLAIARRVVDAHGGHIAVGCFPKGGAVVSFWIPSVPTPSEHSDSLVPPQIVATAFREETLKG
ncbi:MAG TPA: ATP-binding protein [Gemmatimonas sp.]|uniref:sensor histidine kinase n=1 Tax=Gemmatimonas sp. TaxID=1962908 RepID=UPI002ED9910C